jgi:hypothetical protein
MVLASAVVAACLPTRPEGDVSRIQDRQDGGESGVVMAVDGGSTLPGTDAGDDPHGVAGVSPPHGAFSGGQRAIVSGTGFSFHPRVWFGASEVPASDVVAISSKKLQVAVPAGAPGTVDVAVQSGDDASTRRVLPGAYTYDSFYADPTSGPTSGGTVLALHGSGTSWDASTTVTLGGMPCGQLAVKSAVELTCVTPPEPPGSKPLVVTAGGSVTTVLDGFVYSDSDNGFKGGLSGNKLAGQLKVLAFDSYTGAPLTGALVIAGDSLDTAIKGTIDASGVALLTGTALNQPVTVTVAKDCTQPITFVAVPVDTVTMYMDPVKSTSCGSKSGDPPPVGGKPGDWPTLAGQIQFPSASPEFQGFARGPWSLVPDPKPGEKRVAYIFNMASDPNAAFQLPSQPMVTEDSPGDSGYQFSLSYVPAGNIDLYALVGLQDASGTFTAFAFGITKGISTKPGATTTDVAIQIDHTLDQKVTLALDPPGPGPNGPDRVATAVAVSFGAQGYAVFPGAQKTTFLPLGGEVDVLGLPALTGNLAGATYVSAARAATGGSLGLPESVVRKQSTTSASTVVTIDGFVGVPVLGTPKAGSIWDGAGLSLSQTKGTPADLFVYDVESGQGLVGWTIAAPGNVPTFSLPDLRKVKGGLVPGAITITAAAASITSDTPSGAFDYGKLRYRHLGTSGWTAYAEDVFHVALAP